MNRIEILFASSAILFGAFCVGWLACWLFMRFRRGPGSDQTETEQLTSALYNAEFERDQAMLVQREREEDLTAKLQEVTGQYRETIDELRDVQHELHSLRSRFGE